mmetsp:Transcript_548/g.800  ORF Transcript_548/g.800 Transcript_548/m.800 type:complete len:83 (+) Transcript_548:587-835(+)
MKLERNQRRVRLLAQRRATNTGVPLIPSLRTRKTGARKVKMAEEEGKDETESTFKKKAHGERSILTKMVSLLLRSPPPPPPR